MSADVLAAIDRLLQVMSGEMARLADAVREVVLRGQFEEAQRVLARTQRVERLRGQVQQLRQAWAQLDVVGDSAIEQPKPATADECLDSDEEHAPEVVAAEALFGAKRRRKRTPQVINATPQREYTLPILRALERLGGKGRLRDVLDIVYEEMRGRLTEDDLRHLPSHNAIRWDNAARWRRLQMVREGLLSDDSPVGVWEITAAGRMLLERTGRENGGEE